MYKFLYDSTKVSDQQILKRETENCVQCHFIEHDQIHTRKQIFLRADTLGPVKTCELVYKSRRSYLNFLTCPIDME